MSGVRACSGGVPCGVQLMGDCVLQGRRELLIDAVNADAVVEVAAYGIKVFNMQCHLCGSCEELQYCTVCFYLKGLDVVCGRLWWGMHRRCQLYGEGCCMAS